MLDYKSWTERKSEKDPFSVLEAVLHENQDMERNYTEYLK